MNTQQIRTFCELSPDAERLLERAMQQQGLSARAHDRILKVARTIADLDGSMECPTSPSSTSPRPSSTAPSTAATGHSQRLLALNPEIVDSKVCSDRF
jgi:hypothetical protein